MLQPEKTLLKPFEYQVQRDLKEITSSLRRDGSCLRKSHVSHMFVYSRSYLRYRDKSKLVDLEAFGDRLQN